MYSVQSAPDGAAFGTVESPLGAFTVVCVADGLYAISFPGAQPPPLLGLSDAAATAQLALAQAELHRYFAGEPRPFTLTLAPRGTAFQRAVWQEVAAVPFGETRSYAAIAVRLGRPLAARAVGHANGANPLPVVIPCHRLVGGDGQLRGYAGGLPMKQWLLDHERAALSRPMDRS
jgi:methylated-DNA-[protein]-cysteine S-methyltransferase